MKIYTVCIFLLFLFACNVQAITINEIMPNPLDEKNEWFEIYNPENEEINLSLLKITDNRETDEITCNTNENCSLLTDDTYFIILGRNANITEITNESITYFYVDDTKIGNYLGNDGDNVSIHNSTHIIDNASYPPFPDEMEGYSWSRMENGSWFYCGSPTPGKSNFFINTSVNQTNGSETNITDETCDLSLSITSDLILISGEKHTYYLGLEDENCDQEEKEVSIEYWIEDLFGDITKSEYTTTQSMICSKNISRQWTPKDIDGSEAFYITANITNSTCNDSDHSNDFAERIVIVKGEKSDPEECPPCETKKTACSCGPCPTCTYEKEEEKKEDFEIISYPEEIRKDEEIEIKIEIRNPMGQPRNYTVYSYVYEGNKPMSLGFDGKEWLNTWDANKKNVSVPGNSSVVVELNNRIAEDTTPGEYKLRVRIWVEGRKSDITKEIVIKEPLPTPSNQTTEEENETKHNKSEAVIRIPTGEIIHKGEENWFSNFIENLINFFKSIFRI